MDKIISIDKTCAVKGRSVHDKVSTIRNVIRVDDLQSTGCVSISLDQSKTFDKVYLSLSQTFG